VGKASIHADLIGFQQVLKTGLVIQYAFKGRHFYQLKPALLEN